MYESYFRKPILSLLLFCVVIGGIKDSFADVSDSVWKATTDKIVTIIFKDYKEITGTIFQVTEDEVLLVLENGVLKSYAKKEIENVKILKTEKIEDKKPEQIEKPKELVFLCGLHDEESGIDFSKEINKLSFGASEANKIVSDMAQKVGVLSVPDTFESSAVSNAAATYYDGQPIILYNKVFMDDLSRTVGTEWTYKAVLAHELGHHVNFHLRKKNDKDSIAQELEADYFMGFAMAKMGATLDQAQSAMKGLEKMYGGAKSATHPAAKDRLEKTKSGFCDASGTCKKSGSEDSASPSTPEAKKTTDDSMLYGYINDAGRSLEFYYVNPIFPQALIREGWDKKYSITNLFYYEENWHLVMRTGLGWVQVYKNDLSLPSSFIKEYWDKGYRITSISYENYIWSVVMTYGSSITSQRFVTGISFPAEEIRTARKDGFAISEVVYDSLMGTWTVLMDKGKHSSIQRYKFSKSFDEFSAFLLETLAEGYYISSLRYVNGYFLGVMTYRSQPTNQSLAIKDGLKNEWSLGRGIYSVLYGHDSVYGSILLFVTQGN